MMDRNNQITGHVFKEVSNTLVVFEWTIVESWDFDVMSNRKYFINRLHATVTQLLILFHRSIVTFNKWKPNLFYPKNMLENKDLLRNGVPIDGFSLLLISCTKRTFNEVIFRNTLLFNFGYRFYSNNLISPKSTDVNGAF